jgi:hypothetical protein
MTKGLHCWMGYPYFYMWWEILSTGGGGFGSTIAFPTMPTLFIYGKNKRAMFHGQAFLDTLDKTDGCGWREFDCGHFIQVG